MRSIFKILSAFIIGSLSVVTAQLFQSDLIEAFNGIGKTSNIINQIDYLLPQPLTDVTRPFTRYFTNLATGLIHGFTNYNLDMPLFCLLDAPATLTAYLALDASYKKTGDRDVYQNLYDVGLPLGINCNPLTIGGNLLSAFFVLFPAETKALFNV